MHKFISMQGYTVTMSVVLSTDLAVNSQLLWIFMCCVSMQGHYQVWPWLSLGVLDIARSGLGWGSLGVLDIARSGLGWGSLGVLDIARSGLGGGSLGVLDIARSGLGWGSLGVLHQIVSTFLSWTIFLYILLRKPNTLQPTAQGNSSFNVMDLEPCEY